MNRPRWITYDTRFPQGGGYRVTSSPCPVSRPNRTAAGMSMHLGKKKLRSRTQHEPKLSTEALRLTVKGTLDPLAGQIIRTEKRSCTCCGAASGKLALKRDDRTKAIFKLRRKALRLNPARLP